jgi:hypothetical protein
MADDPSKFVTLKYDHRGRKIIKKVKIYYDRKVFSKKADEKVVANLIDIISENPKDYVRLIETGGSEEIESTYRQGARYEVKRYMTPALFITK